MEENNGYYEVYENVKYYELSEHLRVGREIEFAYNNKAYGIVNTPNGFWHLCSGGVALETICPFDEKEFLISRLSEICLDGVKISKIFDDLLYDPDSLCIL